MCTVHGHSKSWKQTANLRRTATRPGTIDPAAALHNDPAFKGYFELRDFIVALARSKEFQTK
ncbi:hypothetical protein BH11VER1_BH11VER1_09060 [soil metagenome]